MILEVLCMLMARVSCFTLTLCVWRRASLWTCCMCLYLHMTCMQSAAGSVNLVCMPWYARITACMTPWTSVWKWGKKLYSIFYSSGSLLLTLPIELLQHGETLRLTQLPAWLHLSCPVKPSIPRKMKGDLYYACMMYSCCCILCSRHGWKPIQFDWWRAENHPLPHSLLWIFMQSQAVLSPAQGVSISSVSPFWVSDLQPYLYFEVYKNASSRSYYDFVVRLPITSLNFTFVFSCLKNVLQEAYVHIYEGTQWLCGSTNKHNNQVTAWPGST